VGVNENFFELGGHSLLAVTLFAQIKAAFGKQLPLATLFHAPTIEHLAAALGDGKWQAGFVLVPIQPNGSRPPLFMLTLDWLLGSVWRSLVEPAEVGWQNRSIGASVLPESAR